MELHEDAWKGCQVQIYMCLMEENGSIQNLLHEGVCLDVLLLVVSDIARFYINDLLLYYGPK